MRSSRCSGRWSVYLLTIRCASSPGPGKPSAIGIAGLDAAITTDAGSEARIDSADAPGSWPGLAGGVSAVGSGAGSDWRADMDSDSGGPASTATAAVTLQHGQAYL